MSEIQQVTISRAAVLPISMIMIGPGVQHQRSFVSTWATDLLQTRDYLNPITCKTWRANCRIGKIILGHKEVTYPVLGFHTQGT